MPQLPTWDDPFTFPECGRLQFIDEIRVWARFLMLDQEPLGGRLTDCPDLVQFDRQPLRPRTLVQPVRCKKMPGHF